MKKFFKVLLILLVIFVVLPVALAFIFIFDTGKMPVDYDDNFNKEEWSKALVVDSLDYAPTEQVARFSVSENDINNFIHDALKDNAKFNEYVTQLAVDITDDSYVINVSGKLSFFETRAKLTATLEKMMVASNGFEEEAYVFTVKGVSLGRLTKIKEVIMFFLRQFLNNETLDALTTELKIHTDLKNSCIFIYASDLRDLINNVVMSDGAGENAFFFTFINDFLNQGLLEFNFYRNDEFGIDVKLNKLTGNDYGEGQYVYYNMPYEDTATKLTINGVEKKLSLDVIREAIVSLLNSNTIDVAQMSTVSDYLFYGYDPADGGNAPSCDLSSIGITNKTAYVGFKDVITETSMDSIFVSRVAEFAGYDPSLHTFDLVELHESDVNGYMKSQKMLGIKYFLERTVDGNTHKANYIALDNAYINLTSNKAIITAGLNINGLETIVTLPMLLNNEESTGSCLVYDAEPLYFGATPESGEALSLQPETEALIFSTLKDSIKDESFFFVDNGQLKIDFGAILQNAIDSVNTGNLAYDTAYKAFLNSAQYHIQVVGDDVALNSTIKVVANRP